MNLAGGSAVTNNVIGSRRWLCSSPLDPGSLTFLMILSQEPITINICPSAKVYFVIFLSTRLDETRLGEDWRIVITTRQLSGESTVSGFQSCMSVCSHRGKVPTTQDPSLSRGPQTDSNLFKLNLTVQVQLKSLLVTEWVQYLK